MISPLAAQEEADIITIAAAEIRALNVHRITDVLNQVPGLKASSSSIAIRGSTKVLVLLDGRPINDPTSSHGGVKFDLVSLENIEKIEIYRGKGGVKYGDNASGGVILIYSRRIDSLNGNLKIYAGNFATRSVSGNCQSRKQNFGLALSAGYYDTDGYKDNNAKQNYRGGLRFSYAPTSERDFSLSLDYLNDERELSGRVSYPTSFAEKESTMFSSSLTANLNKVTIETFYNQA